LWFITDGALDNLRAADGSGDMFEPQPPPVSEPSRADCSFDACVQLTPALDTDQLNVLGD